MNSSCNGKQSFDDHDGDVNHKQDNDDHHMNLLHQHSPNPNSESDPKHFHYSVSNSPSKRSVLLNHCLFSCNYTANFALDHGPYMPL